MSGMHDMVAIIAPCTQDVEIGHRPDAVLDLIESDVVALQRCGEEKQAPTVLMAGRAVIRRWRIAREYQLGTPREALNDWRLVKTYLGGNRASDLLAELG